MTGTTPPGQHATQPDREPSGAQKMFGDFAPGLVQLTDDVLFGQVWKRPQLSAKERSLVTVACLATSGNTDQLVYHLGLAKENGNAEEELIEALTHLAFYAGWPKAMAAMAVAKQVLEPGKVFDLVLALTEVAEGYKAMDERRAIKALLTP
jgi:4-carboxymuconolactone decarboxylase